MAVANFGTGPDYPVPNPCMAVTGSGAVYAEDMTAAKERACGHATFVLGDERPPKLEGNSIDMAPVLDAYHHFDQRGSMLAGFIKRCGQRGVWRLPATTSGGERCRT